MDGLFVDVKIKGMDSILFSHDSQAFDETEAIDGFECVKNPTQELNKTQTIIIVHNEVRLVIKTL